MLTTPNTLAAYLYFRGAEKMPEDADEEWFLSPDPFTVDVDILPTFLEETQRLIERLESVETDLDAEDYQTMFYDAAKATFDGDKKKIRSYFAMLYTVMYGRPEGSRWGEVVKILGRDNFCLTLRERFATLI